MDRKLAALIGAAARAARKRAGLTQAEVAELLEIATEVYGRLERGVMLPSVETLMRLSTCLDVAPNELLGLGSYAQGRLEGLPAPKHLSPEMRRLLRLVDSLDRRKVRLISLIAGELGTQQAKAAKAAKAAAKAAKGAKTPKGPKDRT